MGSDAGVHRVPLAADFCWVGDGGGGEMSGFWICLFEGRVERIS